MTSCDDSSEWSRTVCRSTLTLAKMPCAILCMSLGRAASFAGSAGGTLMKPVGENGLATWVGLTYVQTHLPSSIFQVLVSGKVVGVTIPCHFQSLLQLSRTVALVKVEE